MPQVFFTPTSVSYTSVRKSDEPSFRVAANYETAPQFLINSNRDVDQFNKNTNDRYTTNNEQYATNNERFDDNDRRNANNRYTSSNSARYTNYQTGFATGRQGQYRVEASAIPIYYV